MRRKRNNQEESLTGRQRWAIYRKLFMEARPIWKWLALSCFLCVIIITCAVLGPKLTGETVSYTHLVPPASLANVTKFRISLAAAL